jgi:hypothetical protein
MAGHVDYQQIAKELLKQPGNHPTGHLDHAIRVQAEKMATEADVDELWRWARANAWRVDNELEVEGALVGLFRRTIQKYYCEKLWSEVRYNEFRQQIETELDREE